MTHTHNTPHTPAERDAERARLAAYYIAREAASLPCACPVCSAGPGDPCLPASLTSPHAARERAYGDRLRRDTPDYPDPVPAAPESTPGTLRAARESAVTRRWVTGLTAHLYEQEGKANPYVLGAVITLGLAANGLPVLGIIGALLAIIGLAVILAGGAAIFSHLTR